MQNSNDIDKLIAESQSMFGKKFFYLISLSIVLIIIIFSALLTDSVNYQNKIVEFLLEITLNNKYLLIFMIFFRFFFMFIEKLNIEVL